MPVPYVNAECRRAFWPDASLPFPTLRGKYRDASQSTQTLRSLLFSPQIPDVILIFLNFHAAQEIENHFEGSRRTQLGIATLDLRDLRLQLQDGRGGDASIISTQNYATGSVRRCVAVLQNFRFGVSETISIYDIANKYRESLDIRDSNGERRKVIMLSHQPYKHKRLLHVLKISEQHDLASVEALLNLEEIGNDILRNGCTDSTINLWKWIADAGVPCGPFNRGETAGNEANFGLRALLLLAALDQEQCGNTDSQGKMIDLLRQIGNTPIPARFQDRPVEYEPRLLLEPTEPVDDPNIPVDKSYFNERLPSRHQIKLIESAEHRARNKAYLSRLATQGDAMLEPKEDLEMENSPMRDTVPSDGGLRVRDLNVPRDSAEYLGKLVDGLLDTIMEG